MKTSTYSFKSLFVAAITVISIHASAQVQRTNIDSSGTKMNMDAIYNRPFLSAGKLPVALGGYLEVAAQYGMTGGVSEGMSFQNRRMTMFISSTVGNRIKFLSELEFENGTNEINLEYAAMDLELHPLLNFRGGILMNPIGAFNQNHDAPRWDFIDRPEYATSLIPSTLSNVGMGFNGKYFSRNWIIGYEAYLTNGFDDKIVNNDLNRTSLHEGKENPMKFEQSYSGLPMMNGKLAIRNRKLGEIGLSYMSGVYNKFTLDGLVLDKKRKATVYAVDFNTSLFKGKLSINAEAARILVDVPETLPNQFGKGQWGGYADFVYTVLQKPMLGWPKAKLNVGIRFDYVDYNTDRFTVSGNRIGDDALAIVPSIAFRPIGTTVLRINYKWIQSHDLLSIEGPRTGLIQFGFSTYF